MYMEVPIKKNSATFTASRFIEGGVLNRQTWSPSNALVPEDKRENIDGIPL